MQDLTTTFAGYQLHEELGADAVSTTYRATAHGADSRRGVGPRSVALLVSNRLESDADRRQAPVFQRKARAAMDIDHPGVARVLDTGTSDGRVYLATAWRDSVTLDELIAARWRLAPDEAVALLDLLARGLDAAHEAGLVHGALGTRTIRVDTGETTGHRSAFVTGFGTDALLVGQLGSKRQRETNPVPDDLLYIAPEQLRGGMTQAATDQYALACALYHCVSGQPPFVRDTATALFGAHLFARPEVTDALHTTTNHLLRDALATGLSKRPEDRHTSCTRMLVAARDGQTAARPAVDATAVTNGAVDSNELVTRTVAGVAAVGSTLGSAGDRIATLARSGGTSAGSFLRRLPPAVVPVLALVAGAVLALLLVTLVRGDDASPTAPEAEDPAADAAAGGDAPADGQAAEADPAAEPTAVVEWSQVAAGSPVGAVTVTDDAVVVAADNELVALDHESGQAQWRRAVEDGSVTSSVVTDDALIYRAERLYAVELADGEQRWSRDDRFAPTGALTAVPQGLLYGTGPGRIIPEIMAIDPGTGKELWHFHGEQVYVKESAVSAPADDFVAILQGGTLFAIDPNGTLGPSGGDREEIEDELWRAEIVEPYSATLTLTGDAVLFATRKGEVCSHARGDGAEQWCQQVDGAADGRPTLFAHTDRIIVATRATAVALDPSTGDPEWEAPSDGSISAAAANDDTVVVGDASGTVRALYPSSGAPQWQTAGLGRVTALSLASDAVYAGVQDGSIVRVRPGGDATP